MKAIEAEIMRREMMSMEWILEDCTAVTIHLCWQYLHLLEEQHSAGQGEHLRGQGALTGTEESNHPLPVFRDFCDTEDYLDKSRCSRFTNSLSENKSSAAAIFYHYFVCKVTYYKPF